MVESELLNNLNLVEYAIGKSIKDDMVTQIKDLFNSYYYAYHYIDKVCDRSKYRLACIYQNAVIGYATISIVNNWALLSNFLVHNSFRRCGVGGLLEKNRMRYCEQNNYHIYSSVDTTLPGSQILKLKNGLIPINVKYGYRHGVYGPNNVSSAIAFVSKGCYKLGEHRGKLQIDRKLKRIRLISSESEYIYRMLGTIPDIHDYYVDVLTSVDAQQNLLLDCFFIQTGLECDFASTEKPVFYILFQYMNRRYAESRAIYCNSIISCNDIVGLQNASINGIGFSNLNIINQKNM